jgi:hypothetical protein
MITMIYLNKSNTFCSENCRPFNVFLLGWSAKVFWRSLSWHRSNDHRPMRDTAMPPKRSAWFQEGALTPCCSEGTKKETRTGAREKTSDLIF